MRDPNPQPEGTDLEGFRYHGTDGESERYREYMGHMAPVAPYNYRPVTLEEEAYNGGWLPGARPTTTQPTLQGNDPRLTRNMEPNDLITTGMRGEPGWDDDPQFNNGDPTVTHPPAK